MFTVSSVITAVLTTLELKECYYYKQLERFWMKKVRALNSAVGKRAVQNVSVLRFQSTWT